MTTFTNNIGKQRHWFSCGMKRKIRLFGYRNTLDYDCEQWAVNIEVREQFEQSQNNNRHINELKCISVTNFFFYILLIFFIVFVKMHKSKKAQGTWLLWHLLTCCQWRNFSYQIIHICSLRAFCLFDAVKRMANHCSASQFRIHFISVHRNLTWRDSI